MIKIRINISRAFSHFIMSDFNAWDAAEPATPFRRGAQWALRLKGAASYLMRRLHCMKMTTKMHSMCLLWNQYCGRQNVCSYCSFVHIGQVCCR